jgi:hypothetical protein
MKTRTYNFDSVGEFAAKSLAAARGPSSVGSEFAAENQRDFYGTKSIKEAEGLLAKGWPDGAARIARLRDKLNVVVREAAASRVRDTVWGVEGEWCDVGRIAIGEPECCARVDSEGDGETGRVVTLRYNAAVSGSVSTTAIEARGVAVLAAVDLIEASGVRCEVIYSQGSRGMGPNLECNVVVKAADTPVDLDRLAFVLVHPSFFRRIGFAFLEGHGHKPSGTYPAPLSDVGKRPGTVEINEVCTASGLDDGELAENVLKIAAACGIVIDEGVAERILEEVAS